ncbi:MAG: alpha/beta hydrolase [Candidatus Helarchaeota archaeon]|nr:alpha/beta hydrolase [Candidatus Helarchaeota archaeon]
MPKVKVNDINMYYEIHGEGFPIVMIMGGGVPHDLWDEKLIEELSKRYKTILFDNRGIGQTDKPDIKYSIKMFADDTVGLMDALKINRAHVFGISMGGNIAQEIALNYPDRVAKLVLCASSAGFKFLSKLFLRIFGKIIFFVLKRKMKTAESTYELFKPRLYTEEFIKENPDHIEELKPKLLKHTPSFEDYKRQYDAVFTIKQRDRLKNISTPTLILHGKKDAIASYKYGLELAELIPYSKLALFEKSSHSLFVEEPEKVIPILLEFLA